MKSYYYHCYYCNNIPSIKLNSDDSVNIICPLKHEKTTKISDFCNHCIKLCHCENGLLYDKGKYKECKDCSAKIQNFSVKIIQKYIKFNTQDEISLRCNTNLRSFIHEISDKIEETQKILNEIKYELYMYQSLITTERKLISDESISNLKNLEILKNIENKKDFFLKKINEINNEFNQLKITVFNKKDNGNAHYKGEENINHNEISKPEKINKSLENKNKIYQKRKEEITYKNYLKNPEKPLYQVYGIKLEDIETRSSFITTKLINISVDLEEINFQERNLFLENTKNIGEQSIKFSSELSELLKSEFQKQYQNTNLDNSDKMKRILSSWFNQSLILDESNNNKRLFFDYFSCKEINRIKNFIQTNSKSQNIFSKNKYNYEKLFSDLIQLYTESLFYSEKEITFQKVENCYFINDQMKDITDISGKKIVKYTVLPGLFAKESVICKILVFCEKYPIKSNNTIKTRTNHNCYMQFDLDKNRKNILITINVVPKIKETDIQYKLEFKEVTNQKYLPGPNNTFIVDKVYNNKTAICSVYKNKELLCRCESKIQVKELNNFKYIKKNISKK